MIGALERLDRPYSRFGEVGQHTPCASPFRGDLNRLSPSQWFRSMPAKNALAASFALAILMFAVPQGQARQKHSASGGRPAVAPASLRKTRELVARLREAIPSLMREGDVPGLGVAVVRGARIAWVGAFGVKNIKTREPVDQHTMFEAASLSKPVFAYAVLKMADRGELDLDAPLTRYLPGYIEGDERLNLITARRVLTHTAGFPNWRPYEKPLAIVFAPGERFSYSGEGFVYLQRAVERLTGKPLDDVVRKEVFEPLGMTSSTYVWSDAIESPMASGHSQIGTVMPRNKQAANAAASLRTTPRDYAAFVIAVMQGSGLRGSTARQMLSSQVRVDAGCSNCIGRQPTRPSETISWGLGIGLQRSEIGDAFWHWGDNPGFKCYVAGFRKRKAGVVILTNSDNGLGIIPEIAKLATGGDHPAFKWLSYEAYNSPIRRLRKAIDTVGIEAAIKEYRSARARQGDSGKPTEGQMNSLGYQYLRSRKVGEAIAIFELNIEAFPASANAYDSLAEAYLENGDTERAIRNYRRSVELKPDNTNGIEMLKKLEKK